MRVYDVSDVTNPTFLYFSFGPQLIYEGEYGYELAGTTLAIYDTSQSTGPALLGSTAAPPGSFTKLYEFEDRLFVVSGGDMYVYDIADPTMPALTGTYSDPGGDITRLGFGPGQVHLLVGTQTVVSLSIAGETPCTVADVAEPFDVLDLADVQTFVQGFVAMDPT